MDKNTSVRGGRVSPPRRRAAIMVAAVGLLVGVLAGPSVAGAAHPSKYLIKGVPQIPQLDYSGCGAAAMAMMFDYWGQRVDYKEVVDVVRSMARGCSLMDAARAGQFSWKSAAPSDAYPGYQPTRGYVERKLGYGAFFYASTTEWFDQLKDVIAEGYPVQVLTDWTPDEYGPHYRTVVGYDDVKQVVYLNDPWPYGPWLDMYKKPGYKGWTWPYADFLDVWAQTTDNWGLAGYQYGAVISVPWKVQVQAPRHVRRGEIFTVKVRATYRCPAPFGAGPEATFPTFPASDATAALVLPPGFSAGDAAKPLSDGTLDAAERSGWVVFKVKASRDAGTWRLGAQAAGTVSGSVPEWGNVYWKAAYSYSDRIGGRDFVNVTVE
jgi:hypothetical protein